MLDAIWLLAQAPAAPNTGPSAATVLYLTLLFIFVTAIVTAVATKWSRDKCLKFFHRYHVTLERTRGQTIWGMLKVFSSGVEIVYDHPYIDPRGRKKTSFMIYQPELEQQLLSLLRYHDELDEQAQQRRRRQVHRTFNPGPMRRMWRGVRNFVNTLRDAFNAAIGAAVGQYQRMNPASAILTTQAGSVTQIGQTLLGKFAGNAYEPLLEQYIGQPVILDVADPINPNNATVQYAGYLADYTQSFVAIFNVEHTTGEQIVLTLPDVERGEPLPPLPPPPPPGAPPPVLPPPLKLEHELAVRVDGYRMKIQNLRHDPVVVRRLEREGFEPLVLGMVIPPNGTLDLPARDARGGRLYIEIVRCLDVVAPRKFATVRHAGELVERRGFVDELEQNLDRLPLVPKLFRANNNSGQTNLAQSTSNRTR
ncbi:hypothetical protein [Fontivita pretiosa]|uniref:hypothetical protein n=1 Tax=Fontivita pretiosa TaxID=2989684 RepID=UPI003D17F46D